jgi:hypothetical protein
MYKTHAKKKILQQLSSATVQPSKLKLGLDSHPYSCIEATMIHDLCIVLPKISSSMIYLFEA